HAESRSCVEVQGDNIRIGRQGDNDLVLASPLIADQALVLQRTASDWEVLVTNPGGCQINRTPLKYGDRVRISGNCRIDLFPFTLELEPHANGNRGATQQRVDLEREASSWLEAIHTELLG